ncbi:hypothetical protein OBBRIDRAFT_798005 [Obba rivulosa]|uniref:Uncharacterized protein n=1 Tax=Obba rivulosa TaxID=1052685 RepID=A0A8E2AJA7_9APHY|nr:hypothetical protein OBBRIDRAFT_798005 [Obba rivulosa]
MRSSDTERERIRRRACIFLQHVQPHRFSSRANTAHSDATRSAHPLQLSPPVFSSLDESSYRDDEGLSTVVVAVIRPINGGPVVPDRRPPVAASGLQRPAQHIQALFTPLLTILIRLKNTTALQDTNRSDTPRSQAFLHNLFLHPRSLSDGQLRSAMGDAS